MESVDILVLGTSAERRAGSSPAEGNNKLKSKGIFVLKKNGLLIFSFIPTNLLLLAPLFKRITF